MESIFLGEVSKFLPVNENMVVNIVAIIADSSIYFAFLVFSATEI
jgi:hypothetical protein